MRATEIKRNFGKRYATQMTPFKKFWGGGFDAGFSEREIAEDAWNAAIYTAIERLRMYQENGAADLLDILIEEQ